MRVEESGLHRITQQDRGGWDMDGRSSPESRRDRGDSRSRQKAAYGGGVTGNTPVSSRRRRRKRRGGGGCSAFLIGLLAMVLAFTAGLGTGWYRWGRSRGSSVNLASIQPPDWITQKLIRKNVYSRPAVSLRQVNDIVIHYVANPGSTAEQNRNYFDGLADQSGPGATSASAHFVIGLDGEIIQCIPISEIAYASNNRNSDSIAIECCHPDETGEFTEATYESLVKLTAWLCDEAGISRKRVIRHYDITGKVCPKYFVDHEDAWKEFLKAVKEYPNS